MPSNKFESNINFSLNLVCKVPNITVAAAVTTTTAITSNSSSSSGGRRRRRRRSSNEKLSKYKDLEIEVSRMWKVMAKIVPYIIGALGTVNRGLHQTFQLLPHHLLVTELQITLMCTAHKICKMLQ